MAADTYYVSLTPEEMAQYTYTTVQNCNFQAKWFINVRGSTDVVISGATFPAIAGGVVYNVIGSGRTITVSETDLQGHLLAPQNILNNPGGVINGKVVAGDITMSLQINRENNCPEPGIVELPTTEEDPVYLGGNFFSVSSLGGIREGDRIEWAGNSATVVFTQESPARIYIDAKLSADVPAGTILIAKVDASKGRPPVGGVMPSEESSASIFTVSFALIFALIALF